MDVTSESTTVQKPGILLMLSYFQIVFCIGLVLYNIFFSNVIFQSSAEIRNALIFLVGVTMFVSITGIIAGILVIKGVKAGYFMSLYFYMYYIVQNMYGYIQTREESRITAIESTSLQYYYLFWAFMIFLIALYMVLHKKIYTQFSLRRWQVVAGILGSIVLAIITVKLASDGIATLL